MPGLRNKWSELPGKKVLDDIAEHLHDKTLPKFRAENADKVLTEIVIKNVEFMTEEEKAIYTHNRSIVSDYLRKINRGTIKTTTKEAIKQKELEEQERIERSKIIESNKIYGLVIFDLHGTLIESPVEYRKLIAKKTLCKLGLPTNTEIIEKIMFSDNKDDEIAKLGVNPKTFWDKFNHYDLRGKRLENTIVYPDVEVLQTIKGNGFRTAIISGAPRYVISADVEKIGKVYFDKILSVHSSTGRKPKPHPEGLYQLMEHFGNIRPEQVIYVANNVSELVEGEKSTGVNTMLINRNGSQNINGHKVKNIETLFELEPFFRRKTYIK